MQEEPQKNLEKNNKKIEKNEKFLEYVKKLPKEHINKLIIFVLLHDLQINLDKEKEFFNKTIDNY